MKKKNYLLKKILLVLCTALCLPFISCSNDAIDDEVLTRGEALESQYEETIDHYTTFLEDNGYSKENKYDEKLIIGSWEFVNETAEIYIDGEKEDASIAFMGADSEDRIQEADYVVGTARNDYHRLIITRNSLENYNIDEFDLSPTENKWTYTNNFIIGVDCTKTKEELINSWLEIMPWQESNDDFWNAMSYLPVFLFAEVASLTTDRLVLKIETLINPWNNAVASDYFTKRKTFVEDKSGTHAFSILEYKRVQN